ncbi:zinc finger protein 93-like isoform X2 [Rhinatrema bivittatum]|nr:zinc finger protein 93-like isoform X2 [Rhinatrema bivittatum]
MLSDEDILESDEDDGRQRSSFAHEQSCPPMRSLSHDHIRWENYAISQTCAQMEPQQEGESSEAQAKKGQHSINKPLQQIHEDASCNELVGQKDLGGSEMIVPSLYFLCETKVNFLHRSGQISSQAIREHQMACEKSACGFTGHCFCEEYQSELMCKDSQAYSKGKDAAPLEPEDKKYYKLKPCMASSKTLCLESHSTSDDLNVLKGLELFKISSTPVTSSVSSSIPKQPQENVGSWVDFQKEEISTFPLSYEQREAPVQVQGETPTLCSTKKKRMLEIKKSTHSKPKIIDPVDTKFNSKKPGNFKCKLCSAIFQYAEQRRNHMNLEHKNNKMYVCSYCQRRYSLLINLRYHLKAHKKMAKSENKQHKKRCSKKRKMLCNKGVHEDCFTSVEPSSRADKAPKIFSCKTCLFSSRSIPLFVTHTKGHKGPVQYRCPLCDYAADLPSYLLNHMYWHTGSTLYQCTDCPFITRYLQSMRKHNLIHTQKPHPCNLCDLAFISVTGLQRHMGTHAVENSDNNKSSEKIHACGQCGVVFFSEVHLSCHTCTYLETTQCDAEPVSVSMDGDRATRTSVHHPDLISTKKYKCQLCSYTTPYFHNLRQHFRVHTGEKPYKCKLCEKLFRTASHLQRHKFVHLKVGAHKCDQCGHFSRTSSELAVHQATHQGNSSKPSEYAFKCRKCEFTTTSKKQLQKHKGCHSASESTKILQSTALPRLFQCELCTYITSILGNLKIHKRIHTGEKPYRCNHCDKAFRTSHHLQRHKSTHAAKDEVGEPKESPIKMYVCEECKYTTFHSGNYKQHLRIHTGEKPYKCDQCDLAFRTSGHRRRHVLTHWKSEYLGDSMMILPPRMKTQ